MCKASDAVRERLQMVHCVSIATITLQEGRARRARTHLVVRPAADLLGDQVLSTGLSASAEKVRRLSRQCCTDVLYMPELYHHYHTSGASDSAPKLTGRHCAGAVGRWTVSSAYYSDKRASP